MVSTVLYIQHSMCSIVNTFKGNLVFQFPLKTLMIINLFMGGNNILSETNFKKCYLRGNNYIKHKEECFIKYPNTEKLVEKTRHS